MTPEEAFEDNEDLQMYLEGIEEFQRLFQELINRGDQYTLRLEINGIGQKLNHCRVSVDNMRRPKRKTEEKE